MSDDDLTWSRDVIERWSPGDWRWGFGFLGPMGIIKNLDVAVYTIRHSPNRLAVFVWMLIGYDIESGAWEPDYD